MPDFLAKQTDVWGKPVSIPVLYMHGTNDGCIVLDNKSRDQIPQYIPNAHSRIEMVDGVGHFMNVQKPELVSKLILDFFAERP
jgi:pimeloyl-ACP methyl ester carboxylesterase